MDMASLIIQGLSVALGAVIAVIFNNVNSDLKVLNSSVVSLNERVADMLRNIKDHGLALSEHHERINSLETRGINGKNKNRSRSI